MVWRYRRKFPERATNASADWMATSTEKPAEATQKTTKTLVGGGWVWSSCRRRRKHPSPGEMAEGTCTAARNLAE
jgi:hypothetical protein